MKPAPHKTDKQTRRPLDADLREMYDTSVPAVEWMIDRTEPTDAELAELWERDRDTYMAEWVAEHPGTRPWVWWRFDAPAEPRRLYALELDLPAGGTKRIMLKKWEWGANTRFYGRQQIDCRTVAGAEWVPGSRPWCLWEDEGLYLERHGLLFPGEVPPPPHEPAPDAPSEAPF